jgi:C4-dicarboxylate-specific signal transduction histidine kinase
VRGSGFIIREEDSPIEVRGFLEDVTEEKLQEEKKLERLTKMAVLGELGFSINHETLNPLSVISLCSDHLSGLLNKNEIDRAKVQNCLTIMNKAVDKTANIIKSMRIFSDGQNQKNFEINRLKEIVMDSLELCQDRIRWYDIQLSIDVSPDIMIECRPLQISQIIMNLVLNSILSIKELKTRWIKIWAHTKDGKIILNIQDSGDGIPSDIAAQIMKPFFSTRNGEGTGMGLYISRNFAHQHQGCLRYDPTSPHTLFTLELPFSQKK